MSADSTLAPEDVVKRARALLQQARKNPRTKTSVGIGALHNLLEILDDLVVGADGALATAKRLYTEAKGTGHAIELATADVIEQAERLNKQLNGNSARNIFTASKRIVEEVEREAGFVVRTGKDLIGKHQEWVTKGSSSRAFGIACTEMALGSVMTSMGTQMLSTAIGGQRQKAVETNVGPDGTVTLTGVFVPIPKTERVIKAVIGGATTATGIAATASGFFNIFRGM